MLVKADKTANFYKMNVDQYNNLLKNTITKDYSKNTNEVIKDINCKAKNIELFISILFIIWKTIMLNIWSIDSNYKLYHHFGFFPVNVFRLSFLGVIASTFFIRVFVVFAVPFPGVMFFGVLVPFLEGV